MKQSESRRVRANVWARPREPRIVYYLTYNRRRTLSGVGPRCVRCFCDLCLVCVFVCVYSRVALGASYVGRPICVCAVSAPLRLVNR